MDTLIVHMVFDPATDTYKPGNNNCREEVDATVFLFSLCSDLKWARDIPTANYIKLRIYSDSGTTICLRRLKHLRHMGLSERNLVRWWKKVYTVGGFSLVCHGWLPVTFKVGKRTTKQVLNICWKVLEIYFRKAVCIDVGILPPCFHKPMTSPWSVTFDAVHPDI